MTPLPNQSQNISGGVIPHFTTLLETESAG